MLVWILINVSTSSGGVNPTPGGAHDRVISNVTTSSGGVNPTPGGAHVSLNSGVGVYQTPTLIRQCTCANAYDV
jgi:hypothetical protein